MTSDYSFTDLPLPPSPPALASRRTFDLHRQHRWHTDQDPDGTTAATGATIASGTVLGAVAGDTLAFSNGSLALNHNTSHVSTCHRHPPSPITSSTPAA
ncbi:MAG: hypothetical protein IPO38_11315 [Rhodocyclaceae bacterium]|nr:hypothetical protein [Rhodocyclaceae bacterium]